MSALFAAIVGNGWEDEGSAANPDAKPEEQAGSGSADAAPGDKLEEGTPEAVNTKAGDTAAPPPKGAADSKDEEAVQISPMSPFSHRAAADDKSCMLRTCRDEIEQRKPAMVNLCHQDAADDKGADDAGTPHLEAVERTHDGYDADASAEDEIQSAEIDAGQDEDSDDMPPLKPNVKPPQQESQTIRDEEVTSYSDSEDFGEMPALKLIVKPPMPTESQAIREKKGFSRYVDVEPIVEPPQWPESQTLCEMKDASEARCSNMHENEPIPDEQVTTDSEDFGEMPALQPPPMPTESQAIREKKDFSRFVDVEPIVEPPQWPESQTLCEMKDASEARCSNSMHESETIPDEQVTFDSEDEDFEDMPLLKLIVKHPMQTENQPIRQKEFSKHEGVDVEPIVEPPQSQNLRANSEGLECPGAMPEDSAGAPPKLEPGSHVVLRNLRAEDFNGVHGYVVNIFKGARGPPHDAQNWMVDLRVSVTGQLVRVKQTHVITSQHSGHDRDPDSMSQLMPREEIVAKQKSKGFVTRKGAINSHPGETGFEVGDAVELWGTSKPDRSQGGLKDSPDRVPVHLEGSRTNVSMRAGRIRRLELGSRTAELFGADRDVAGEQMHTPSSKRVAGQAQSEQTMHDRFPPTGYGSKRRSPKAKTRFTKEQFIAGEPLLLRNMARPDYNGTVVVVLATTDDKDLKGRVAVQLPDGRRLVVPSNHLVRAPGTSTVQPLMNSHQPHTQQIRGSHYGSCAQPSASSSPAYVRFPAHESVSLELHNWCKIHQLDPDIEAKLAAEGVRDPEELAVLADEDLVAFSADLRLGQKGRFMMAIRELR